MAKELNSIQARVLRMLAHGYTVPELACAVGLSECAVEQILRSAMHALDANTIPHAAAIYRASEILEREPALSHARMHLS